ncbi:hypothetical protein D3C85_771550 [compost metagenome]
MADQAFQCRDRRADIKRRENTHHRANRRADHTDHRALHHERAHDRARRRAQRTQNGDVALLVVDHHHQRGNDVERSDGDDQQQQQADHGFFHTDRLIQIAVGAGPVAGVVVVFAKLLGDVPCHTRRLEQVVELQANALHLIRLPAVHLRQILQVGHAQIAIKLASADMENADNGEALHAREHPGRGHADLRRDEGDLVTDADAELGRSLVADDDAEAARRQIVELALFHEVVDDRHIALERRVDGIEQYLGHLTVIGQQALHLGERRNRRHLRVLLDLGGQALPIVDRLSGFNGRVGHHAQHTGAHLMIEAVHHRQHDDHHDHAKGEPDHRSQGNE